MAVYLGMLGLDFRVDEPPDLVDHVRSLADRYGRAVAARPRTPPAAGASAAQAGGL